MNETRALAPVERLTIEDIRRFADPTTFRRAEAYCRQGRVRALAVFDDGARVECQVQGTERRPYSQAIRISERQDGRLNINGMCSCPVGINCKHVAAALITAMKRGVPFARSTATPAPVATVAPPPPTRADVAPADRLSPMLVEWVESLARLERTETDEYPPDIRQRLVYLLDLQAKPLGVPYLVVQPMSTRLLKDGGYSTAASHYALGGGPQRNHALFVRPTDRAILNEIQHLPRVAAVYPGAALSTEAGAAVLRKIIATGRARWATLTGVPLSIGPARPGQLGWRLAEDGTHRPHVELAMPDGARVIRMAPPHYVDLVTGMIGPVEIGQPPRIAEALLSAPPVPPRQADLLRAAIARRAPGLIALEPPGSARIERVVGPPKPRLTLLPADLPRLYTYSSWSRPGDGPTERLPLARLEFRYGEVTVGAAEEREVPTFARDGKVIEVERELRAEQAARGRIGGLGLARLTNIRGWGVPEQHRHDLGMREGGDAPGWIDLLHHHVPTLRAEGWEVEIAADFPIRVLVADTLEAELNEGSGIDWFELELGVTVDGERLDLVPILLPLLSSAAFAADAPPEPGKAALPMHVPLPDGRVLIMPAARLRPILAALHELFAAGSIDPKGKKIAFSPLDAPAVADLEAAATLAGAAWRGGERLRELGRLLRATGGIPEVTVPGSFAGALRPYQARGVDWMQFLRAAGLGGVLADEMGLGKTVQTLAYLAIEQAAGRLDRPALVIAPTSLVPNWRREAEHFAPRLKVLVLHGAERKARFGDIVGHDLVITTYPLLSRDHAALSARPWHVLVLDEAQTIKNPEATTTKLVRGLEARHRLCLTGTPLENHLGELWSLFAFLSPGFLGDKTGFKRMWRTPIEKRGDGERRRLLARRVRPFLLRRTKAEVASDLPPKTEIAEAVEMEPAQRDVYESIRLAMHAKVRAAIAERGLARSRIIVLDALLKLRQACCDPRLLKLRSAAARKAGSAKLDRLMSMLPELIEDGRRVLLFSQFTSMLALIEQALAEAAMPYVLLTGDTRDRETPIRRFQDGEVPLFLISLKAGGLGLNLTAADTVIHYDPWWNPAVEDQATDRAHRIGQDKPVFVHKLVMLASIEEKMEALKTRKRDLAAGLFDPEAGSTLDLTESDVDTLFGAE